MWEITYEMGFEAAHFLPEHKKCGEVHGHSYKVFVTLAADELNEKGMVMDFADLKDIVMPILPDHRLLNDVYHFVPTAEHLASHFYWELNDLLPEQIILVEVTVYETDKAGATYHE